MDKRYVKGIISVLMLMGLAYAALAAAPAITGFSPQLSQVNSTEGASTTFRIDVDQIANVTWHIGGKEVQFNENVTTSIYRNASAARGSWIVNATASNANGTGSRVWTWIVAALPPGAPSITGFPPGTQVNDIEGASRTFRITVNQTVDVTWYVNGTEVKKELHITESSYINTSAAQGTWIINATAGNANGTDSREWTWIVKAPPPVITTSAPGSPVNDFEGETRSFNITVDQNVNVTWHINGTHVQTNNSVTSASYTNTTSARGTWIVNATATNANGADSRVWTWNVKDRTPPGNVTDLMVADRGQTYINWSWNNPNDTDFDGTRISINGAFKKNLSRTLNNHNETGLAPGASHVITVIAFDTSGNSASPVENTSATLPNTQPGVDVTPIGLPDGVVIIFDNVSGAGNTTVSPFTPAGGQVPGFEPLANFSDFVNISTSAEFTGNVTVTLKYQQPPAGFIENNVGIFRLTGNVWENITTGLNTADITVTGEVSGQPPFILAAGVFPPPVINIIQEPGSLEITVRDSIFFNISADQEATITWRVNNVISEGPALVQAGGSSDFTFNSTVKGNFSVRVEANNTNGTRTKLWNVTVHPRFFFRGNRIWDGSKPDEFSLNYTWDPMSFSGFYYDITDDVGDESITIKLDSYSDRTIDRDDLVYTSTPQEVSFGFSGFGKYEVIGFMAEKYFAGYTASTRPPNPTTSIGARSVLAQGQLHRVLLDDDTRRTVSLGSTLTLREGYVLRALDIDMSARTMLISLLKDGSEVDSTALSAGQTYVYTKRVGTVSDLPIIMLRFDTVFSGTEIQAAFIRGMFQMSESYHTVNTGNDFGNLEVVSVSSNKIEMSNDKSISLSEGSTQDLMGDVKIIVADSSDVRFALSVEKAGNFEVRSSIYREDDPVEEWTPYNFGMNIGKTSIGFYYDLDEGIGNEKLRFAQPLNGQRTIRDGDLLYTASPQEVSFGFSGFGKYEVIGFMAEKYFAGYNANSRPPNPTTNIGTVSVLASGQLHRVLVDDDTRRTISLGSTLTLNEGYVLKTEDIDPGARTMLISLFKDGNEVDTTPLSAGETYVFTKRVGTVSDLPIIMVRFDSVFSGTELSAAFLRGIFQISENYATVNTGNKFGRMEVQSVSNNQIEMSNDGSISLDGGKDEALMGNIRLRVGDTTDNALRFYFAVDVTPEMVANLLVIDAPAQATAGDSIKIKVTAGGNLIEGASIGFDSSEIGLTDNNGSLDYDLPRTLKGIHNMTANKLGYLRATRSIEVLEYIERRLSIDIPVSANQFETITIKVIYNGTAISGATVRYDNTTIGSTGSNGTLNYTLETSGTHSISASRNGYITVVKEIEVRAPFSEYKALDINITPNVVFTNEKVVIRSNLTNAGTKKDTLPVELIINGTAVDNMSVALAPGEIKEINFTRKEAKAGNYTVEILGQKGLLEVKQGIFTLSLILIVLIITGLGAIAVYFLTAKDTISVEQIRKKLKL